MHNTCYLPPWKQSDQPRGVRAVTSILLLGPHLLLLTAWPHARQLIALTVSIRTEHFAVFRTRHRSQHSSPRCSSVHISHSSDRSCTVVIGQDGAGRPLKNPRGARGRALCFPYFSPLSLCVLASGPGGYKWLTCAEHTSPAVFELVRHPGIVYTMAVTSSELQVLRVDVLTTCKADFLSLTVWGLPLSESSSTCSCTV